MVLVEDFYDVLYEVDEESGMTHDASFMEGHLKTIQQYVA